MQRLAVEQEADLASTSARFMAKISEQAREMATLHSAWQEAEERARGLQDRINDLEEKQQRGMESLSFSQGSSSNGASTLSSAAVQRRQERQQKEQLDSLHKLLSTSEQRVVESNKVINKLTQELESASRSIKQFEKKCSELNKENQKMRAQLESAVRVSNGSNSASSLAKSLSSRNSIVLGDELQKTKQLLERCQRELDQSRASENECKIKIQVLSDALEFRTEEIGLSGHADLLTKLSALRGEVTALRSELGYKKEQLDSAESERTDMTSKQDSMQRQISLMQQRLLQSQEDLKRLSLGDLPAQLKAAQQERDVLLEFVDGDMQKSSALAKQIEKLESDIRVLEFKNKSNEDRANRAETAFESELAKSRASDMQVSSLQLKVAELGRMVDTLTDDKAGLQGLIDKKNLELEEMAKLHVTMVNEAKTNEVGLQDLEHSLRVSSAKVHELELSSTALHNDNTSLREKLRQRDDELAAARQGISNIEPRVAALEPEVMSLRKEREQWMQERVRLQAELNELRLIDNTLAELTTDLNASKSRSTTSTTTMHALMEITTNAISSNNAASVINKRLSESLSRQHAAWIGIPSLRSLSPELYECIRKLAADLSRKESECEELVASVAIMKSDMEATAQYHSNNQLRLLHSSELADKALGETRDRLLELETELTRARNAKTILDQLRVILQTFPGGPEVFYDSQDHYSISTAIDGRKLSEGHSEDMISAKTKFAEDLKQAPDQSLPDIIGRALMYNANAVVALQDTRSILETTKLELLQAQMQNASLDAENAELGRLCDHYAETAKRQEDKYFKMEEELKQELDSAVELAEKQNALTISLESKLEGVKRERQLKSAQLTSVQQREDAMAMRLITILKEAAKRSNFSLPDISAEGARLPDIIQLAGDSIARLIQINTVNDSVSSSSMINRERLRLHRQQVQAQQTQELQESETQYSQTDNSTRNHESTAPTQSALEEISNRNIPGDEAVPATTVSRNQVPENSDSQSYMHWDYSVPHPNSRVSSHLHSIRPSSAGEDRTPAFGTIRSGTSMWAEHQRHNRERDLPFRRVGSSPGNQAAISERDGDRKVLKSSLTGSPLERNSLGTSSGPQFTQSFSQWPKQKMEFGVASKVLIEDPLTPSRILQNRLKKAQQAFASMREPL